MRFNNNKNQSQPVMQFRLIFDRSVRNQRLSIRRVMLSFKITYRLIMLIVLLILRVAY